MLVTVFDYEVEVIDGEGLPVAGAEIGAEHHYASARSTWHSATTDGDGVARFSDGHPEKPIEVALFVDDEPCGAYPLTHDVHLIVEM